MDQEQRIENLEQAVLRMVADYWRFQGRINVLEAIATQAIFDRANLEANPFQWVQDYIRSIEVTKNALIPDVDDPSKGERLKKETVIALDEFLEGLVEKSGSLRGAPPQRPRLARCNRLRRRIQHTTCYSELSSARLEDFWSD